MHQLNKATNISLSAVLVAKVTLHNVIGMLFLYTRCFQKCINLIRNDKPHIAMKKSVMINI
jgi:hypothetical protein